MTALLTLRRVLLLLLLLAGRRRASGVGLRSSLETKDSQYSITSTSKQKLSRVWNEHIRQILEEGVQGFADRAQGCMELDCMARGYKVAAVAAVHMTAVLLEEDASSHPVAVVHIVAAVHIAAAAAAVHIAVVVVPATGIHRPENREIVCSVACQAGAALDMVNLVAELAQQMRRRQPDVLREACRGRVGSRSRSQKMLSDVEVVESPSGCVGVVGVCLGKAQTRSRSKVEVVSLYLRRVVRLVLKRS